MGIAWRGVSVRGLAWDKSNMYNIWTASVSWSDVGICFFFFYDLECTCSLRTCKDMQLFIVRIPTCSHSFSFGILSHLQLQNRNAGINDTAGCSQ
jgi:hypothetical protein